MVHDIHICLVHRKTWHSLRASGRHALSHREGLSVLEEKGIFVNLGECRESIRSNRRSYYMTCNLKMRDSTNEEIELGTRLARLRANPEVS